MCTGVLRGQEGVQFGGCREDVHIRQSISSVDGGCVQEPDVAAVHMKNNTLVTFVELLAL